MPSSCCSDCLVNFVESGPLIPCRPFSALSDSWSCTVNAACLFNVFTTAVIAYTVETVPFYGRRCLHRLPILGIIPICAPSNSRTTSKAQNPVQATQQGPQSKAIASCNDAKMVNFWTLWQLVFAQMDKFTSKAHRTRKAIDIHTIPHASRFIG